MRNRMICLMFIFGCSLLCSAPLVHGDADELQRKLDISFRRALLPNWFRLTIHNNSSETLEFTAKTAFFSILTEDGEMYPLNVDSFATRNTYGLLFIRPQTKGWIPLMVERHIYNKAKWLIVQAYKFPASDDGRFMTPDEKDHIVIKYDLKNRMHIVDSFEGTGYKLEDIRR